MIAVILFCSGMFIFNFRWLKTGIISEYGNGYFFLISDYSKLILLVKYGIILFTFLILH